MTLRRLLLAALAGFGTCGLWIALLTLELNPEVAASAADALLLIGYFVGAYSAFGAAAALAAGLLVGLIRWTAGAEAAGLARRVLVWVLAVTPIAGALLLPDTGLARTLVTHALFGGPGWTALLAAAVVGASIAAGWGIDSLGRRLARRGTPRLLLPAGLWLVLVAGLGVTLLVRSHDGGAGAGDTKERFVTRAPKFAAWRAPVVLLCIDGADPDDAVWPLIDAGELPTLARLRRWGVWGELETLYPTLSPTVWTTLATGKPPAEHGVHHFVLFDLPGIGRPVRHFPLHTGLNFRLISWVERLPGAPAIQVPYSSNLRRARPLWDIAGEKVPVGVYGWRVTWPAQEVNGFNVSTGVTLLEELVGDAGRFDPADERSVYPPEAVRHLERPDSGHLAAWGHGDRTVLELTRLIEAYRPEFVAAAFYSVDGNQHRFSREPAAAGAALPEPVIAAYRRADRRLRRLLAALDETFGEVNLIVVSDHGYDFRHHHHTHAPPGMFLANGPAFKRGKRIEGLSVYDVAPMVLHALGLPVAEDMPALASFAWRRPFRAAGWATRIATHERGSDGDARLLEPPLLEETKRRLRALGYLH